MISEKQIARPSRRKSKGKKRMTTRTENTASVHPIVAPYHFHQAWQLEKTAIDISYDAHCDACGGVIPWEGGARLMTSWTPNGEPLMAVIHPTPCIPIITLTFCRVIAGVRVAHKELNSACPSDQSEFVLARNVLEAVEEARVTLLFPDYDWCDVVVVSVEGIPGGAVVNREAPREIA